jgi:hypothetical protein
METVALGLQVERDRPAVDHEFVELDDMTRNTIAFMNLADKNDFLKVLGRYESSARRAYHRALKDLRDLQAERKANLPNEPMKPEEEAEIDPETSFETGDEPAPDAPKPLQDPKQPRETHVRPHR